jgi:hypothetical protein
MVVGMTLEAGNDQAQEQPEPGPIGHSDGVATDRIESPEPGRRTAPAADERLPFVWHG